MMFFIAIAIFVACLVAIAALVLAAIMISMVRSGNTPLLLILIPMYKVRNSKRLRVSRHAKFESLLLTMYCIQNVWEYIYLIDRLTLGKRLPSLKVLQV